MKKIIVAHLFAFLALSFAHANSACVRVFDNANSAFEIRQQLIETAQKEIIMSYYALEMGPKVAFLLTKLKEASVNRGVKVQLLVDAMYSKIEPELVVFFKKSNIEIKFLNRLSLKRPLLADTRFHDKYLLIDGTQALVGGRNMAEGYLSDEVTKGPKFYDVDALFVGQVAKDLRDYFIKRWGSEFATVAPSVPVSNEAYDNYETKMMSDAKGSSQLPTTVQYFPITDANNCNDSTFWSSNGKDLKNNRSIESLFIEQINNSNRTIDLQSAYLLLTPKIKVALKAALKRNVKVRIISNSLKSNDVLIAQSAYLNQRRHLLNWGAEVHEFMLEDTMHAKLSIFDNERAIIGSFNLDPRSAKINSEIVVLTEDRDAIHAFEEYFQETLEFSALIDKKGKPVGYSERFPGTTQKEKTLNTIYRYTVAPIFRSRL